MLATFCASGKAVMLTTLYASGKAGVLVVLCATGMAGMLVAQKQETRYLHGYEGEDSPR